MDAALLLFRLAAEGIEVMDWDTGMRSDVDGGREVLVTKLGVLEGGRLFGECPTRACDAAWNRVLGGLSKAAAASAAADATRPTVVL
jgi:hypothetical protein